MSKAKKWICLAAALLAGLFMAIGLFGISLQSVSAAVDSAEAENAVIVERKSPDKISGSNYAGYSIQVAFADAPQLTGEETFWGVKVQNLRAETARVRYGFEMGGGVCLWLGPADTVNYFVSDDGTITPFIVTNAQYIDIPANFSGYVYTPKAACYGWTSESESALVKNNYRAKGVRWAYDYRAAGSAKVALYGLSVANFTETEGVVAISDFSFATNFDAATANNIYLGGDETAQAAMAADLDCRIVPAAVFDAPISMEITQIPTLTEYAVGTTVANYTGGVVAVTYSAEDVSETISYPLTSSVFTISGFDASIPTETLPITVTLAGTQITATFNVKIGVPDLPDADEEEGQYIVIQRTDNSVNVSKTGWMYFQFAMLEFIKNDTNAVGGGNCLGVRIENLGAQFNLRIELRSKNAGDAEKFATHRTGMANNINAFAWFVEDGSDEVTSVGFNKTSQTLQIPEGAAGTLYLNYETDFSWKGHTAAYGISHVAFGIDMRGTARPCFIVKEIFDAQYTVHEDAEYTDIEDIYDNTAGENTHFTTDVTIVNLQRFFSSKECNTTEIKTSLGGGNTIECGYDVMILGSPSFATWTTVSEEVFQSELSKVRVAAYDPDDFTVRSISMKTQPKAQYTVGDLADWSEGIVTVTYASGRTQDYAMTDSIFEVSGFSSIAVKDSLTITVTFAEDADIFTTFTVSVAASGSSSGNEEDMDDTQSGGCSSSVAGFSVVSLATGAIVVAVSLFIRKKRI